MGDLLYKITDASIQLGDKPPFNCVGIPVRMLDGRPQVKVGSEWWDYPRNERRVIVETFLGHPVAGIATTWEADRG